MSPGVRFRNDLPNGGLANVAATVMNLHGFEAPSDYEPTLIVVDNQGTNICITICTNAGRLQSKSLNNLNFSSLHMYGWVCSF